MRVNPSLVHTCLLGYKNSAEGLLLLHQIRTVRGV
jgi:hypothetical protein